MAYQIINPLPSVSQLQHAWPLSAAVQQHIQAHRREIQAILRGQDDRLLLIVGPCSAWPKEAALDYANRLQALQFAVQDRLKIVMRVYVQKPRTRHGWLGPLTQPDPWQAPDLAAGLYYARELMVKVAETGLAIADEAVFTDNASALLELISWLAIGARSTQNPQHRLFASSIDCPVGFKNPTYEALTLAMDGIAVAQQPQVMAWAGQQVHTSGNPDAHLVLRGSCAGPNYSLAHLQQVAQLMQQQAVRHPAVVIDVSHDNCRIAGQKRPEKQSEILWAILTSLQDQPSLRQLVKGFMVESFLQAGQQTLPSEPCALQAGLSITDPCLGWQETQRLIEELAQWSAH